ncbi:MAG TPA: protein kinase [Terriglobales bacterium]|nr:protein kinase [Terriglobales bacterium]
MPLTAGLRLGPYEILGALGAGGMGEVYRARDTRLGRDVAVKILSSRLVSGPELRERFEREARTISQLSHPHICPLYDVGRQDDVDFLVMEYLEGETLEHRLMRGPLPADQLLKIAIQVSDALGNAHQHGVVHRDLKPGNVMLTKTGAKLMDFGLAKLRAESAPAVAALAEMVTAPTRKLTVEGTLVGTFQYMAPEQLEGGEVDARSDIFALGAVIYEMAAGRPAFTGKSKASLIAAILSSEPKPLTELQPMTPPALEHLVRTCLAKNPEQRWQTAHDLKLELEWVAEAGSKAGVPAPVLARRKRREWLLWGITLFCFLVALAGLFLAYREHQRVLPIAVRSSIEPPEGQIFAFTGDVAGPPVISPDGTRIVFAASDQSNHQQLWLRSLNSTTPQLIAGTDNATFPFWSPDSRKVGFFADGSLKISDLSGTPPVALINRVVYGRGGAWSRDGRILFSPGFRYGLISIPSTGGAYKDVLSTRDTEFTSFRWPQFMPDGKHFIYLAVHHEKGIESSLFFASLDDPKPKLVMRTSAAARFGSGRLLFMRNTTLMSQKFDPTTGELSGEATPLADQVLWDAGIWRAVFDVSENGIAIHEPGTVAASTRLAWMDRAGKQLSTLDVPTGFQTQSISPDGRYLAVQGNPSTDLWIYDLERGVHSRLTFEPMSRQFPIWSPDGRWVASLTFLPPASFIMRKRADGIGPEEKLLESKAIMAVCDWSPDGKHILYAQATENGAASWIWALPLDGDRKPFPLVQTPFYNAPAVFSPDGKWIAYQSNESGRPEIYVTTFPQPSGKWQVSTNGGYTPKWGRDGKEIFYIASGDTRVTAVPVRAKAGQFTIGEAKPLFRLSGTAQLFSWFEPSTRSDKFLAPAPMGENQPPLTLITNWTAALSK